MNFQDLPNAMNNLNAYINQNKPEFPDDLDSRFKDFVLDEVMPYRELPLGDYKIISERSFKTKDSRDCMVLTLFSKDKKNYTVYTPDRLRQHLSEKPNTYNYLRNLGLKTSKYTENEYFDYQLA